MPIIKVGDINMYYEVLGEGEPLILIGGLGSELSVWNSVASGLAQKYQVISFDNRGAGRTDKPDIPYTMEMMAEDTIGLMDALGIKNAHLLGISMGSFIAQLISVSFPEKVRSLVLNVASARFSDSFKSISDEKLLNDAEIMFTQKYPPTSESFIRQLQAERNFDIRDQLNKINAPTIIINAKEDPISSMEYSMELESGIDGSRLVIVEGDHFFAIMEPKLLIDPVLDFLEGIESD